MSQDRDLNYGSAVRGSQNKNPSKPAKLSQFFDFTGDFNRNICTILKPEKLQHVWGSHIHLFTAHEKYLSHR